MDRLAFYVLGLGILFFSSCGPKVVPSVNEDFNLYVNEYEFERTKADPKQEGKTLIVDVPYDSTTQQHDITEDLDRMLSTRPVKAVLPLEKKDVWGWRIQVYRGRSREEASRVRQRVYDIFSNRITPYMIYKAPTYRIQVGDFLESYEARPYLKVLKREFPNSVVVPDKVSVVLQSRPKPDRAPNPNNPNEDQDN